jgi:DNA-directed RNA polymerase specialized sigma24 family protein
MELCLPPNLGEAVRQAQTGSQKAADKVFELCEKPLLAFIDRLIAPSLRSVYDADDCLNETMEEVCEEHYADEILGSPEHLEARIKKTAANNARDARKKHVKRGQAKLTGAARLERVELPSRDDSPEAIAGEYEVLERKLAEATRRMPEAVRGIVPLWLAGEKPKDIARKLGLKVRRVYRWIEWVKKVVGK